MSPCFDPRDRIDDRHNNEAAELLCTVLRALPRDVVDGLDAEVRDWWKEHLERDADPNEWYARKFSEERREWETP